MRVQINALWRTVRGRLTASAPMTEMINEHRVGCIEEICPPQHNFVEEVIHDICHDLETARMPPTLEQRLRLTSGPNTFSRSAPCLQFKSLSQLGTAVSK